MDLAELVNEYLGSEPSQTPLHFAGDSSQRFYNLIGNEDLTVPLIASFFWQAFISSSAFPATLESAGASPLALTKSEKIVVRHNESWKTRYSLVIFDPGMHSPSPIVIPQVEYSADEIISGWLSFIGNWPSLAERPEPLQRFDLIPWVAAEASAVQSWGMIIAPPPRVEFTAAIPTPRINVKGISPAMAGVLATNEKGIDGVTAALHAVGHKTCTVTLNGHRGTVISKDAISDSCFIEIQGLVGKPVNGPLRGVTPRVAETVTFDRYIGTNTSTTIIGYDYSLPYIRPESQTKVYTKPDTAPGDSGTALIDSHGNVIGFAFYRTGLTEPIEHSAWIWAESVFEAHQLS